MKEKNIKKNMINNNNGITLIALVITIIVMLILVGVTISMAVNGGLFQYAGNTTRDTEVAKQDELKIAEGGIEVDEKKYNTLDNYMNGIEETPEYSASLLDESTGVLIKNAIYIDSNKETVEIPKGFKVSSNSLENTKAGGLVIQDEIENEFVWIPVEDYKLTGNEDSNGVDSGLLSYFKRTSWSNNERSSDYTKSAEYIENATNDPTEKYNEMLISIQKHKGFYIGRYEAGEKENGNIVVKRDKRPYTRVIWGDSMTSIGTSGAVYLSQNMYKGESHNVKSTLCYGVQWDAMLDFIKDANHNVNLSADWGNYSDTNAEKWKITRTTAEYCKNNQWKAITEELTKSAVLDGVKLTTGANDNFQAKNIYDVAGNVNEWTMEAYSSSRRIMRGGNFIYSGNYYPASSRSANVPSNNGDNLGFRPALYISNEED